MPLIDPCVRYPRRTSFSHGEKAQDEGLVKQSLSSVFKSMIPNLIPLPPGRGKRLLSCRCHSLGMGDCKTLSHIGADGVFYMPSFEARLRLTPQDEEGYTKTSS
jgi:hypothetical protein